MANASGKPTVAVIGLGPMGGGLADALLSAHYPVIVWNRTASKAEPLVDRGARSANSVADAVTDADITITCVAEHAVIVELLQNDRVQNALGGKVLIQLGVVTAEQARQISGWAQKYQIGYLEGSILGIPKNVREATATLVCSGPVSSFNDNKSLLSVFGNPQHISEAVGAAYDFDKVYYSFAYAMLLGYLQGAAAAHAKGFSIEAYTHIVNERVPNVASAFDYYGGMIAARNHAGDQAALETWAAGYTKSVGLCRELGIDDTLPSALMSNLQKAIDAGYGDKELSSVFEVLLPNETK